MRSPMVWISCLALLALPSCDPAFEASHPEGYLTYDPNGDALRLVEISAGLHAKDDEQAARALAEFLAGSRIFPPGGGFISYDLDQAQDPAEPQEALDRGDRLVGRIAKLVTVRERGLYTGDEGELGLWRISELAPAKEALAAIDEIVSEKVLEMLATPPEEGAEEYVLWRDPQSRELWHARALAGGPWVTIEEGRLVVDLPISAMGAAQALRELVQASQDEEIRWLLAKVWRIENTPGGVRLWLGTAEGPMIHFGGGAWAYGTPAGVDSELIEAVSQAGLPRASAESIGELRERYGLPSPTSSEGILELGPVVPSDREGSDVVALPWWSGDPERPRLTVAVPLQRFRLKKAVPCDDQVGYPAICFDFADQDAAAFRDFTARNVEKRVAIVVGGRVVSAPVIVEPLRGSGILSGSFSEAVRDEILAHLRSH